MYCCDAAGDIYQSRDNAESWRCISDEVPAPARHLCALGPVRMLAAATDAGVYLTTTGGYSWRQLPLPPDSGRPLRIQVDPSNPFIIYAVTDRGVYRSKDFGDKHVGSEWECLSAGLPRDASITFAVGVSGGDALLYAIMDGAVYTRAPETEWAKMVDLGPFESTERYPWLVVDPSDPRIAYTGFYTGELGGTKSLLTKTIDGGATWTIDMAKVGRMYAEGKLMQLLARMIDAEITSLAVDPRNSDTLYAGTRQGLLKSSDGGESWDLHADGFDIPWVTNVMAPPSSSSIFAGTHAGLYRSRDRGETFDYANLRCQFQQNTVREIGGAAYIDAYWLGRYHGFIDDETANTPADEWD